MSRQFSLSSILSRVFTKLKIMRKMFTIILILMLTIPVFAPSEKVLYLLKPEAINYYNPLIKALTWVEVRDGKILYNPLEDAVGYFQIRPIRVEHYNKLTGSNYKLEDFYDYELSRKMFLYYTKGRSYEEVARSWNGSGPKTIEYWKKVQKVLLIQ